MEEMLNLMKALLGLDVSETSFDVSLNFYLEKAKTSILNYINDNIETTDESGNIKYLYPNQTVELAVYLYRNRDNIGLVQEGNGSIQRTYESDSIPKSIKQSLPLPRIKLM